MTVKWSNNATHAPTKWADLKAAIESMPGSFVAGDYVLTIIPGSLAPFTPTGSKTATVGETYLQGKTALELAGAINGIIGDWTTT